MYAHPPKAHNRTGATERVGYLDDFLGAVEGVLRHVQTAERAAIKAAAELVADSIAGRGIVAVYDTGHLLKHEASLRAGALVALTGFAFSFEVDNPVPGRNPSDAEANGAGLELRAVALALDASNLRPGDTLILNSNSGRTANVIELALQARARDIRTIGIASRAQMAGCAAVHPSGSKLFDVVDCAIGNGTPHGDACVPVRDNDPMCPLSGIASALILWAVQAEAVERLQARGVNPTFYRSVHIGGQADVDAQVESYKRQGA